MEKESVVLPDLEVGDHLLEAYSAEDRLLLSDYEIVNRDDLRHLREIGVRYAFVSNRDTEVKTRPETTNNDQKTTGSKQTPSPLKYFSDCQDVYQNLTDQAENFFEELQDNSIPNDSFENLQESLESMISQTKKNETSLRLLSQLKNKQPQSFTHSVNLALLSLLYGSGQDFGENQLRKLSKGALLHDIGKTKIPQKILKKNTSLTSGEKKIVKKHPREGLKILRGLGCDKTVRRIVHEHHERPDGTGYPEGTTDLHPFSTIVSVLEVYESLTSPQPYRESYTPVQAYKMLFDEFGEMSETRAVVKNLVSAFGLYPVGSYVQLSNQDIAIVTEVNEQTPRKPVVKVVGAKDTEVDEPFEVNLEELGRATFIKNDKVYSNDLEIQQIIDEDQKESLQERVPAFMKDRLSITA